MTVMNYDCIRPDRLKELALGVFPLAEGVIACGKETSNEEMALLLVMSRLFVLYGGPYLS